MPYVPVERSIVAANLDKIRRVRNLAFKSTGSTDLIINNYIINLIFNNLIINFEREIQRLVDQPEKVSGMCFCLLISTTPFFLQRILV